MSGEWVILKALLLAAINGLALLGNISLFLVLLRKPALRTQTNVFILNLAAADILVATVNMPLTIATLLYGVWMFGEFVCRLSAFLNLLSFVASVMSLAVVSVNRYHFVVKWRTYQKQFSKRRCALYIMLVWLFSGALCLPPLLGWAEYRFIAGQSHCFVDWSSSVSYLFSMAVICLLGPATTMVFSYWNIWTFSYNSVKRLKSRNKCEENSTRNANMSLDPGDCILQFHGPDEKYEEVAQHVGSSALRELAKAEGSSGCAKSRSQSSAVGGRRNGRDEEQTGEKRFPTHRLQNRHHQKRQREDVNQRPPSIQRIATQPYVDAKLTRTLLIIVVTFCLCWSPYTIVCILLVFLPLSIPTAVWFGVMWLGCANSACNVLIYISTSRKIRKEFLEMFKGWFCR